MNNDKVYSKRESLHRFIVEQTLGPGVCGYRFVNRDDSILKHDLSKTHPLNYSNELINVAPAGVYSTGILFPIDNTKLGDQSHLGNQDESESVESEDVEPNQEAIENEDEGQLDQMYPNTIAITCSLDSTMLNNVDLSIRIRTRYYKKIDIKSSDYKNVFGILCETEVGKFQKFLDSNDLSKYLNLAEIGPNKVLFLKNIAQDDYLHLKPLLRGIGERNAEELSKRLAKYDLKNNSKSLSSIKQSIFYQLKRVELNSEQQNDLYQISQELEQIENCISHIEDLAEINDSRYYGLWQSNPLEVEVPFPESKIPEFVGKRIYSYTDKRYTSLRDVIKHELDDKTKASISVNLQLTKSHTNKKKVLLKIQVQNTSTHFTQDENDKRYYSGFNEKVNQRSFFNTRIALASKYLVPFNISEFASDRWNEDEANKFLYRQLKDYGIGHGCSVKWESLSESAVVESEYIPYSDTPDIEAIPKDKGNFKKIEDGSFECKSLINDPDILSFKSLSTLSKFSNDKILIGLRQFVSIYEDWINRKSATYDSESDSIKEIVRNELEKCQKDKQRMRTNIESFFDGKSNEQNLNAFRLMNTAMFMQLWHGITVKKNGVTKYLDDSTFEGFNENFYKPLADDLFQTGVSVAWRPFQLAFILLNLDGIFRKENDPKWEHRNELVDLVWFPTGGGKTEAYLGIIALTIINRRLRFGTKGGGTAVMMRYTLRLLTLQQFQRATLLIMSLELIRRWNTFDLGMEPIYIGMWVGDNSLPNRMDDLIIEFEKLDKGQKSKIPYEHCPWCGAKLSPSSNPVSDANDTFNFNRLHLKCSNLKCSFFSGRPTRRRLDQGPLPVSLCDEEIYQHPPALLFGTVDKFAQLAHKVTNEGSKRNADSRRLFGRGNWEKGKPDGYLTPDLIIQDELHLLLGPLGSAVALFESAIDQLSTREDGTRAKVISSTATTRNTNLQIAALFDRKVNLFPKLGVECDDSFFAFYKRTFKDASGKHPLYESKRRYIGILPTGRTQIWMQMRLVAIVLTHRALFESEQLNGRSVLDFEAYSPFEKAMDYYGTVVSYFNSLKEVGRTESQINTYIIKEIRRVFNRVIRPANLMHSLYTYFPLLKAELTGRLSGEEVKNELQRVSTKWVASKRFANKDGDKFVEGRTPPDFVVATNMISVGIDISRLNLIIMNSMPRNIAEYIQASSRVARDSFGIVLTVHHPFRARDVSHYETFIQFHEKMYSYVEPISITPFTKNAINKYLGLYLATMLRHTSRFVERGSASEISNLSKAEIDSIKKELTKYFEKRRQRIDSIALDEITKNIIQNESVQLIDDFVRESLQEWKGINEGAMEKLETLVFTNKSKKAKQPQEQLYIDIDEYEDNVHSSKWRIPMSLRVIEPEASMRIKLK